MRTWFSLLFFLTLGMAPFGYSIEPLTVVEAHSDRAILQGEGCVFETDNEVNWRVGDRAEAIVRDGRLLEVRYIWE